MSQVQILSSWLKNGGVFHRVYYLSGLDNLSLKRKAMHPDSSFAVSNVLTQFCLQVYNFYYWFNSNFHLNAIFLLLDRKMCRHKSAAGWCKSHSDAYEHFNKNQQNLTDSQIWYHSHTSVHTLILNTQIETSVTDFDEIGPWRNKAPAADVWYFCSLHTAALLLQLYCFELFCGCECNAV